MAHCAICRRNNIPDHVADRDGIDECAACTYDDFYDDDEYLDPYDDYNDDFDDLSDDFDSPDFDSWLDYAVWGGPMPFDPIYLGM